MHFYLEFSVEEIMVKVDELDPFSEFLLLLHKSGCYLFNIIKIPSISRIQILRRIPFFKLTSEYLDYIQEKAIPRYKLNRVPMEVSEG
jgi:hypothetical protein